MPARSPSLLVFVLALVGLAGCGSTNAAPDGGGSLGDGGGLPTDAPGSTGGWRRVELLDADERVTGVYCATPTACVVSTDPPGGPGHVYATDGDTITATLITGDADFAEPLGTLGVVSFLGFSEIGDRVMVRLRGLEAAFVVASGDPTLASSWSATRIGTAAGAEFGLNAQFAIVDGGDRWMLVTQGRLYESAEGPGATWTAIWSPAALPPIPSDIDDLRTADPTLCNSDPSVNIFPHALQPVYVASDLGLVVAPAGASSQGGDDGAGVCISTDGGLRFHHVAFDGIEDGSGPIGVACSGDRCVAFGGVESRPDSVLVWVTDDASLGGSSVWEPATLPALTDEARLRGVAFAPDGLHGWLVGAAAPAAPLLLTTADGGHTWIDATSEIRALAPEVRLHSVYALDATHVWIGGEHDVLLTTGR